MKSAKFANSTIIAAAGFLALLLVYSVAKGRPTEYTSVVRVILAVSLGLLVVSVRLRPAHRANLAVLLVATGISLLGAELVLYLTVEGPYTEKYRKAAKRLGAPWDARTRFQVVEDLRAKGTEAHLALTPRVFEEAGSKSNGDPLYAFGEISNTTIVMCNELGEWSIYQSDEHGFNNPSGIWAQDQIDTVSIGDSFIHGQCVKPAENATSIIRSVYKNSLNLGISGSGTLVQLALMKEYLGDLKPKVVLWFLFEANDLPELLDEYHRNPRAKEYLGTGYRQDLVSRQDEIDQRKKSVSNLILAQHLGGNPRLKSIRGRLTLQILRGKVASVIRVISKDTEKHLGIVRNRHGDVCPSESIMPLLAEVLRDGREFVEAWGGSLYLVYLPSWTRYADPGEACATNNGDMFLHHRVLAVAKEAGLSTIDIAQAFDRHADPLSLFPFRLNGHYNQAGYRVVADTILQSIDLSGGSSRNY